MDAYFQAPEYEEVVVELAPEYLERLAKAARDTKIVAIATAAARKTSSRSEVGGTLGRILVNKLGCERRETAPQIYWSAVRQVALELHMDDIHEAVTPSGRKHFMTFLSREIEFKGGNGCELGKPYEHRKRLRIPMTDETRVQPNTTKLESVAYQLGLTGAKTRPTPGVLTHRATVDADG